VEDTSSRCRSWPAASHEVGTHRHLEELPVRP